jgi:uncharacterized protein YkwD
LALSGYGRIIGVKDSGGKEQTVKPVSIIAIVFLLLAVRLSSGQVLPAQSDSLYRRYDYKSFTEYAPAEQRIKMDRIDHGLLNAALFFETNRQRASHKLPLLKHSPALENAAVLHSTDMVKNNYFSHTGRRSGQETLEARLYSVGVVGVISAENIAEAFGIEYKAGEPVYPPEQNGGYFSYEYEGEPILNYTYLGFARQVLRQFMESEHHRENILNPDFHYCGAGAVHFRDSTFHDVDEFKVTQLFTKSLGNDLQEGR